MGQDGDRAGQLDLEAPAGGGGPTALDPAVGEELDAFVARRKGEIARGA